MTRLLYLCLSILTANQILVTYSFIRPSISYYEIGDMIQVQDNMIQDSDASMLQNIEYDKNEDEVQNTLNNFNKYAPISSPQNMIQNSVNGGEAATNIKDEYSGISNRNNLRDSFNSSDFRYLFPSAAKLLTKRSCDTYHRQKREHNSFGITIESEDASEDDSDEDSDEDESAEEHHLRLRCGKVPGSRTKNRDERPSESDGPPVCKCPKYYKPVCGSDGYTYKNRCFFDCHNRKLKARGLKRIKVLFKGKCDSLDKDF